MRNVPRGVKILAGIYIVLAVLSILWSLLVFGVGGLAVMTASIFGSDPGSSFGSARVVAGLSGMVVASLQLVVGIGLLTLKRWAWLHVWRWAAGLLLRRPGHRDSRRHRRLPVPGPRA